MLASLEGAAHITRRACAQRERKIFEQAVSFEKKINRMESLRTKPEHKCLHKRRHFDFSLHGIHKAVYSTLQCNKSVKGLRAAFKHCKTNVITENTCTNSKQKRLRQRGALEFYCTCNGLSSLAEQIRNVSVTSEREVLPLEPSHRNNKNMHQF